VIKDHRYKEFFSFTGQDDPDLTGYVSALDLAIPTKVDAAKAGIKVPKGSPS